MTNLVNIKAWHDALLSGQYPQGQGTLVRGGRYCCLGVACHLAMKAGVRLMEIDAQGDDYGFRTTEDYIETDTLPRVVREWLGIDESDPALIIPDGDPVPAASLNDDSHYTFAQIAECIVRTWPDAFAVTP
jgi:hypothetical protein